MFVFTFKCSAVLCIIFVYSYFDLTFKCILASNSNIACSLSCKCISVSNSYAILLFVFTFQCNIVFNFLVFFCSLSTLCSFFTMYLLYSSYFAFVYLIYNKKISPRQDLSYHLQQYQIFVFVFFEIENF